MVEPLGSGRPGPTGPPAPTPPPPGASGGGRSSGLRAFAAVAIAAATLGSAAWLFSRLAWFAAFAGPFGYLILVGPAALLVGGLGLAAVLWPRDLTITQEPMGAMRRRVAPPTQVSAARLPAVCPTRGRPRFVPCGQCGKDLNHEMDRCPYCGGLRRP